MRRMLCIERSRIAEGVEDPQNCGHLDNEGLFLQTRSADMAGDTA